MANHPALQGRIIVHDPFDHAATYTVDDMVHGSEMTSLTVHGDLAAPGHSLSRPVYVRPIFQADRPNPTDLREGIPTDILPADITYCAVKEMLEGSHEVAAAAPTVRIINMSVGDRARQYDGFLSPWARMIDYLSARHRALFLVSAGNHCRDIELPVTMRGLDSMTAEQLEAAVVRAIAADVRHRRLLAPAESLNCVTIGATHADTCSVNAMGYRKNPYLHTLPAPYSAVGFGHRNGLKPEIWVSGGRQFFAVHSGNGNGHVALRGLDHPVAPGNLVAAPTGVKGEKAPFRFTRGTSGATALGAHEAGLICENLLSLRDEPHGEILDERFLGLFVKALLAHGASWGEAYDVLKQILKGKTDEAEFNRQVSRFLGYGIPDWERVLRCTSSRATLLGRGQLRDGEAHRFEIPLPPSLGGKKMKQRVVVTLAWFSPIDALHRNYRKAALWASKPDGPLKLSRENVDANTCLRGTLQHEVFEGDKAVPIVSGDVLSVQVNCCADAGELTESVGYALAVSLEVIDAPEIPVYDEVRAALQVRIAPRARV